MIKIAVKPEGLDTRVLTFSNPVVGVGRHPGNELYLPTPGVSGQHCKIFQVEQGYEIEDCGSTNGTYVNRRKVTGRQSIRADDEVVVATYSLRILAILEAASAGAAPVVEKTQFFDMGNSAPIPAAMPKAAIESTVLPAKPKEVKKTGPESKGDPFENIPQLRSERTSEPQSSSPVSTELGGAEDPEAARLHAVIDPLARAWVDGGRTRALLLCDHDLLDGKRWLRRGPHQNPNPLAIHREFVRASVVADRLSGLKWTLLPLAAIVAIGAGAIVAKFLIGDESEDQGDSAAQLGADATRAQPSVDLSAKLARQAQDLMESQSELAVQLNIEALRLAMEAQKPGITEAEQSLRRTLGVLHSQVFYGHKQPITAVATAPNGRWFVSGSEDTTARLWSLDRGDPARVLSGHGGAIRAVDISADGRWLVTGSDDETVRLWNLEANDPTAHVLVLRGHAQAVTRVAMSPNSRWLVTSSSDGHSQLWNLSSEDPAAQAIPLSSHQGPISSIQYSPDSNLVFIAGHDRRIEATWIADQNVKELTDQQLKTVGATSERDIGVILDMEVSPNGKWILASGADGETGLWSLDRRSTFNLQARLGNHRGRVHQVAVSPDSKWAYTGGEDGNILIWNLVSTQPESMAIPLKGHQSAITGLESSQDGRWLLSSDESGIIMVWNLSEKMNGGKPYTLTGHEGTVSDLALTGDGSRIVTGGHDGVLRVWELTGQVPDYQSAVAHAHKKWLTSVALNKDGTRMVTGGADGQACIWNIDAQSRVELAFRLRGHRDVVTQVAWSEDDRWVATSDRSGTVRLWDANSPKMNVATSTLRGHRDEIHQMKFTPDGKWLVSVGSDAMVRLWSVEEFGQNKITAQRLKGHSDAILALATDRRSSILATAGIDQTVRLWSISKKTAQPIDKRAGHEGPIWSLAISSDGRWVASGSEDQKIRLRDLEGGHDATTVLRGHEGTIKALDFRSDGKWLASGGDDGIVRLWDLKSEHPEEGSLKLMGHEASVTSIRFSPDGERLYSASNDQSVMIWDLVDVSGESLRQKLTGHTAGIAAIDLSTNGAILVSASRDDSARVWPLRGDRLIELACRALGQGISEEGWKKYLGERPFRASCLR